MLPLAAHCRATALATKRFQKHEQHAAIFGNVKPVRRLGLLGAADNTNQSTKERNNRPMQPVISGLICMVSRTIPVVTNQLLLYQLIITLVACISVVSVISFSCLLLHQIYPYGYVINYGCILLTLLITYVLPFLTSDSHIPANISIPNGRISLFLISDILCITYIRHYPTIMVVILIVVPTSYNQPA